MKWLDADADAWLAYAAADPPPPWVFAIEVEGEAAGTVSLRRGEGIERHSAELGYWIGEAFWGRGIMTAVRTVTERALAEADLYRIFAPVFASNPASIRR